MYPIELQKGDTGTYQGSEKVYEIQKSGYIGP